MTLTPALQRSTPNGGRAYLSGPSWSPSKYSENHCDTIGNQVMGVLSQTTRAYTFSQPSEVTSPEGLAYWEHDRQHRPYVTVSLPTACLKPCGYGASELPGRSFVEMPSDYSGIRTHFSNTGLDDVFLLLLLKCSLLKTRERNRQSRGMVAGAECSAQPQNSH